MFLGNRVRIGIPTCLLVASLSAVCEHANAQQSSSGYVAPPRTISDVTAILDLEKPDPQSVTRLRSEARAEPKTSMSRAELALFHYGRCQARSALGDVNNARSDCEKAAEFGQGALDTREYERILQGLAIQVRAAGDLRRSLEIYKRMLRPVQEKGGGRGFNFSTNRNIATIYISLGDFNQAESHIRNNDALIQDARTWKSYAGFRRANWNSEVEWGHAVLFEARGQFREAEAGYRRAETLKRESLALLHTYDGLPPPADQLQQSIDRLIVNQGRMKARQGRLAEGEADVRRALLSRLKATGKYNLRAAQHIGDLADILVEQGRFTEAEQLSRAQLEIHRALGVAKDSRTLADSLNRLAANLNLQGRWQEASLVYDEIDLVIAGWSEAYRGAFTLNENRVTILYAARNIAAGIAAAERLVARASARFGEQQPQTAAMRGLLAVGLTMAGRDADAMREFKLAVPVLTSASLDTDLDDALAHVARSQRIAFVIEAYFSLLARTPGPESTSESFHLADLIRGRSAQTALAASSARAVASDAALADLARKSQDLDRQVAAELGVLNNALALPPDQRDASALKALQNDIGKLRAQRDASRRELASRFPQYAGLIEPRAPSIDEIRAVLRPDEAFLSFYFGRRASFVWAVPKVGSALFAALPIHVGQLEVRVNDLRKALEPTGDTVADIAPFDVAAGYQLFNDLMKPIEVAWRPAASLIVTTNGALGLLPLGLLPTEPTTSVHDDAGADLFSGYRRVTWLARSHAVAIVPSASSLRTLRQLPQGPIKRDMLIGFGDPYFSKEQAAGAQATVALDETATSRGAPLRRRAIVQAAAVDRAELARLPRLPDTAEELKSIALALSTDPEKVLHLGKDANEQTVKRTDLTKFRIIAFATHGLVPGDLDGLTQPALALTAPDVADVDGDGLLTMEEILALKLNADWVVLSACNTGTAAGAGAEAVSGLGRAFFYAGARSLLVTNWAVHSASARALVVDLFQRQAAADDLLRTQALRQAMMALIDGPGFADPRGRILYSYAHPLFWAPYSIIGDGGG
jgi:CHAT domain-containing protein/tetratricopeptide (TPR) repeat protein